MHAQIAGFAAVFALFLACGLAFNSLTASTQALQGFQAMYYISSFFAQFVNATTFLLVSSPRALLWGFTSACLPSVFLPQPYQLFTSCQSSQLRRSRCVLRWCMAL